MAQNILNQCIGGSASSDKMMTDAQQFYFTAILSTIAGSIKTSIIPTITASTLQSVMLSSA